MRSAIAWRAIPRHLSVEMETGANNDKWVLIGDHSGGRKSED